MAAKKGAVPAMQTYYVRPDGYPDGSEVDAMSAAAAVAKALEDDLIPEGDGDRYSVYILTRQVTRKVVFEEEI